MATCNPSTLIEQAKCFQGLSKKELQAVIAQLLCNISDQPNEPVLVNVTIPFNLVSGTTDSVTYNMTNLAVGWKLVAWNYYINSTSAVWTVDPAAVGMFYFYDVEDNVGLQDEVDIHTGDIPAGIPSVLVPSMAGISPAQPIYFKHNQSPFFVVSWDTQPAPGEFVSGFIRLLVEQETDI